MDRVGFDRVKLATLDEKIEEARVRLQPAMDDAPDQLFQLERVCRGTTGRSQAPSIDALPTCTILAVSMFGMRPIRLEDSTFRCRPNPPAR